MSDTVSLPDETKETLLNILQVAASRERTVVEFRTEDGELSAIEITDHVETLENQSDL